MRPPIMATRRAIPWRHILQGMGTVLTIGGGLVAVSTPELGAWALGFGLLALIAGVTE